MTFKEKVVEIERRENSKIKMLREFEVVNCWNREKSDQNILVLFPVKQLFGLF